MKLGLLTTWRTQCGVAQYSRALAETFAAREDIDLTILASRNYDERETGEDDGALAVVECFDVELWNRHGHKGLDVDRILALDLDVLHVQYEAVLFQRNRLHELMDAFDGPVFVTWHDNAIPPDLRWFDFDHAFSHRAGVGPGNPEIIPFPVRVLPKVVRTFGLGRTREDLVGGVCERNGWVFESAATSEAALGGQRWLPWRELHDWLRGADAICLWYGDNGQAGCSQAARTALATGRPIVVNDVTWFAELPSSSGTLHKVADNPGALEERLREILAVDPMVARASSHRVVETHVDRYREALLKAIPA